MFATRSDHCVCPDGSQPSGNHGCQRCPDGSQPIGDHGCQRCPDGSLPSRDHGCQIKCPDGWTVSDGRCRPTEHPGPVGQGNGHGGTPGNDHGGTPGNGQGGTQGNGQGGTPSHKTETKTPAKATVGTSHGRNGH
jgi:hypothetical protein